MTRREAVRFVVVRSLGNFLLLFSLYGVGVTFGPALYYELQYRIIEARGIRFVVEKSIDVKNTTGSGRALRGEEKVEGKRDRGEQQKKAPSFLDVLAGAKEQILIPIDTEFSILIPKIGVNAKVYPNIDTTKPQVFLPILQRGIAHAKGTVFPGMQGNIYLFAHSTDNWWNVGRVNALFYLLKDLVPGDEVIVFFEHMRYDYVVREKFVTVDTYTDLLLGGQTGQQQLVLQTCWPPGTTWKRLFVLASPRLAK